MQTLRSALAAGLVGSSCVAFGSLLACSDGDTSSTGPSGATASTSAGSGGEGGSSATSVGGHGGATSVGGHGGAETTNGAGGAGGSSETPKKSFGYYFAADKATGKHVISVVDASGGKPVVTSVGADELDALTGANGNMKGPAWGDSIATADGARVFANGANADRVLVLETATNTVETVLKAGQKPLHIYEPNDNGEIWSHNDTDGTFTVLDAKTLATKSTLLVSQTNTGHGKLLYAPTLGTQYFATITANPGAFSIDGAAFKATFVALCGQPCVDDPMTPADESKNTCGGTHDKTFDPATKTAIFQCSGVTKGKVAFYDVTAKTVTKDLVTLPVSAFAYNHDKTYNLVFDNTANTVGVWDANAPGHTLDMFDATVTITGNASGRGTDFRVNDSGEWEAWIPQSNGTKLVVLNLKKSTTEEIEIGAITLPAGESARRGAIAGDWFYTYADSGLVLVNVKTRAVVAAPKPAGNIARVSAALVPTSK